MSDQIKRKVQTTAKEEAERVRDLSIDAARSGAYLYPIRGLVYFLSHRSLWKPFISKLIPTLSMGLGITSFMFIFTYLPQLAVLAFTAGPLAPAQAALLVLSESSAILNMLGKSFMIQDSTIDTFDGTLVSRNLASMVSEGRTIKSGHDPVARLGKIMTKPFNKISPSSIIRYLMYLPLNFIPVIGPAMFIILQGKRVGPQSHQRYFQLKGWSATQREQWIEKNRGAYTSFGVPAVLLEMVPVAGIFFSFTNTVGAALWAADLEQT